MPLAPGSQLGPYEILAPIGAGGMGEVYRARDTRLARDVAVKVLPASMAGDPERLRRFETEARATGQLNHPNIMAIYDIGTHEGAPYVVEELIEGETLRVKLEGSPLPPRKAIDYAIQISQGLAAAHEKGVVHRDLKPENLLVTHDGRVKILDFGLAKLTGHGDGDAGLSELPTTAETAPGVVLGTVGYMSPEQVRGQPTDHRSDIFTLGGILYEMLSGRRAFAAGSSVETMNAILKEEPVSLAQSATELPPGLDRIVLHCLEKGPEERYQSARDLAFSLESLSMATASGVPALQDLRPRRRKLLAPILAVLALAVIAASFLAGRMGRPAPASPEYRRLTFRDGSIFSARFAPDGQAIVYSASWDGASSRLYSTRPEGMGSRAMDLADAEILSISSKGEMAILIEPRFTLGWMRLGRLARTSMDGGAPREILDKVQDADWAPDGGDLVVARDVDHRYRLEYPPGNVLLEMDGWISSPRFSPSGDRVAFQEHPRRGDNRGRVSIIDLKGNSTPLTEIWSSLGGLAWRPDGREIWFSASASGILGDLHAVDRHGRHRVVAAGPSTIGLYDIASDGRVLVRREDVRRGIIGLGPGETTERDLSWLDWTYPWDLSADGRILLFQEQGDGGGPDYSVFIRGTNGDPAIRLGDGAGFSLSPDGRSILAGKLDDPHHLEIAPIGVGQPRTLKYADLTVTAARWFPDGARILLYGIMQGQNARLFIDAQDGSAPRPLTPEGVILLSQAISPDGRLVTAALAEKPAMIYPVDGGEPRAIPGLEAGERILRWSADGRSLFVTRPNQLPAIIERLDTLEGTRTRWKELMPANAAGVLDIGPVLLSEDGRFHVYSYRRWLSTLYLARDLQ